MARSNSLRRCPQCGTDLEKTTEALRDIAELSFCLECHFPVMLVAGKYRLRKMLAQGGFGKVYQARHVHLDREPDRVIKVLDHDVFKIKGMESRFRREVQVTGALSQINEHIVRIYDDFGELPKLGFYYVMEHLQGQPLTALLANPKKLPSLRLCLHIFWQLCDALEAAHREGVIHRDIKPDNIFLIERKGDPYFVKVLDFGIAKPMDREALQSTQITQGTLGTPPYMSPEQCHDDNIDERSDIYAMGVTLYELLVGHTPFYDKAKPRSALRVLQDHILTPPPSMRALRPDREIPEAIEAVVMRALSKHPSERFDSSSTFKKGLTEAYNQAGIALPLMPQDSTELDGFDPKAEMASSETLDMRKESRPWPVADSTSFPKGQLPKMEGASGFAEMNSAPNHGALHSGAIAHTGERVQPQHALRETGNAASSTDQHPINLELPANPRAMHHDSAAHAAIPDGFVSYDSGRYDIALGDHEEPLQTGDYDDEDDEDLVVQRSYRMLLSTLMLALAGGVWAVLAVTSWKARKTTTQTLRPQAGAICGNSHKTWPKRALRVLVLPLADTRQPVSLDPKVRVRWQRMRRQHERSIQGIKKYIGVLGRDFLALHISRKAFDQPSPLLNHQRARMYGELCRADIVVSAGWLTTSTRGTNSPKGKPTLMAWMRLFATFTGSPLQLHVQKQTYTLGSPPDLDELVQADAKALPGPRISALLHGLVFLRAAKHMNKSLYLSAYLRQQSLTSLKRAQVLNPAQVPVLKEISLQAMPKREEVEIPAGPFWMGPADKAKNADLPKFWIDRYEVSREDYAACVLKKQCPPIRNFLSAEWLLPRDRVTTKEARAFCAAEGKSLPTAKQWIKAARGGLVIEGKPNPFPKREMPWGNTPHACSYAHTSRCYRKKDGDDLIATMVSVRRQLKGISPYGLHHMLGNAAEILDDGSIKGGSGYAPPVPISWKNLMDQRSGLSWVGFRCARTK